jgi:hypothetical protein
MHKAAQITLDSVVHQLQEVARICVLERDLPAIIPAGSTEKAVKGKFRDLYKSEAAPILLSLEGDIEIYRRGKLDGKGQVVFPRDLIKETIDLASSYVTAANAHGFIHGVYPRFDTDGAYSERITQIWNNADWEVLPEMLRNTEAFDLNDDFVKRRLCPNFNKYRGRIILLSRD